MSFRQTTAPATPAEIEALRWLTRDGETRFFASSLAGLYAERYREREAPRRVYATTSRSGAWNRISGSVMARMRRKGLLTTGLPDGYTATYHLTRLGEEAIT